MRSPWSRLARTILILQGIGVPLWWLCLALFPAFRNHFFPPHWPEEAWAVLIVPDLLVYSAASLVAAVGVSRRRTFAEPAAWIVTGAGAYAAWWCWALALYLGKAWLGVVAMTGVTIADLLIACWIRDQLRAAPDEDRARRWEQLRRTAIHTAALGLVFLVAIPATLTWMEFRFGLRWPPLDAFLWRVAGLVILVASTVLGYSSGVLMAWWGRGTPLPLDPTHRLVLRGAYAYVRNPMAIAGLVQGAAVGLILGSWLTQGYILCGFLLWNFVVRRWEERDLLTKFGAEYEAYRRHVRCWWPRWTAYRGGAQEGPAGSHRSRTVTSSASRKGLLR
jgi:protein-S-isoprenylcysteine O-methyltransferase Ste14